MLSICCICVQFVYNRPLWCKIHNRLPTMLSSLTATQLMGLAVYNSIILDIHFPPCCYKKLLSPATMPRRGSTPVGMQPDLGLQDLIQAMPVRSSYHSLKFHFQFSSQTCCWMHGTCSRNKIKNKSLKESSDIWHR